MTRTVLIERLLETYGDPFRYIHLTRAKAALLVQTEPAQSFRALHPRTAAWNAGRVRWFMDDPTRIDSIEVDNNWHYTRPDKVVILDGHHRLCAAILLGLPTIQVSYGGDLAMLRYLTGQRKSCPW